MTVAKLRKLLLSLPGVAEVPHMDRRAFRTQRKIFATLGADERLNLKIEPEEARAGLMESFPRVFHSLGGWTRLGFVAVDFARAEEELLRQLITEAYTAALPRRPPSRSRSPARKRR
jgi:hypothetical protein